MILWSKGLGKLVLGMRLEERSGMGVRDELIVIDGTMGAPTFWDYAVNLDDEDVVDFITFLSQPVPVRFLVSAPRRGEIFWASLVGIGCFVRRTLYRFLGGKGGDSSANLTVAVKTTLAKKTGGSN
jgi:hypothetical protein